jgi:hypothetical protein
VEQTSGTKLFGLVSLARSTRSHMLLYCSSGARDEEIDGEAVQRLLNALVADSMHTSDDHRQ